MIHIHAVLLSVRRERSARLPYFATRVTRPGYDTRRKPRPYTRRDHIYESLRAPLDTLRRRLQEATR